MNTLEDFEKLLHEHDAACIRHTNTRALWGNAFKRECEKAYKKAFPRRKFTMPKSRDQNPEVHTEIYDRWQALATALYEKQDARIEKLKTTISEMALALKAPVTEELSFFRSSDTYAYNSQGWGASKYARNAAEAILDRVRAMGHEGEIREVNHKNKKGEVYNTAYQVWINTTSLGVILLKEQPFDVDLVEWVRKCWKRGVNPRVYNPFLPVGFEEKHGLNYFGGYKDEKQQV